jgi:hypothetical protein
MDWIDLAQDMDQWSASLQCNEPSDSIKFWEILEWLHKWWLLKKGSFLWSYLRQYAKKPTNYIYYISYVIYFTWCI